MFFFVVMVFIFITIAAIGVGTGTGIVTVILTIVRISDFINKWWDMKSCYGMQSSAFIICYIKYQSIVVIVVIVVAIASGFGDEHVANTT